MTMISIELAILGPIGSRMVFFYQSQGGELVTCMRHDSIRSIPCSLP